MSKIKELFEVKNIIRRFDRGYTNSVYGDSDCAEEHKMRDFERLIELSVALYTEKEVDNAYDKGYTDGATAENEFNK
tara:strand:- start:310 stop:540 length:231 start_codon:yes stop_codon:yes gene_type:complete